MSIKDTIAAIERAVEKGEDKPTDLLDKARRLVERSDGDLAALVMTLLDENYQQRVKRREMEQKLPKEGGVILSTDEAARWEALKGFDPADITKKLEQRETFEKDLQAAARVKTLTDAAILHKFHPDVLIQLAGDDLDIEITGDGDKKAAVVKAKDGSTTPLTDFAKTQWAAFAASLQAQPASAQSAAWVPQPSGDKGQPTTLIDDVIKRNAERANAPNALTAVVTKG